MKEGLLALRQRVYTCYPTEASMARRLGWPRQRLNSITTGRKTPDIEEVAAIAGALGAPILEVVTFFLKDESPNG